MTEGSQGKGKGTRASEEGKGKGKGGADWKEEKEIHAPGVQSLVLQTTFTR